MSIKITALILAGGTGSRMKGELPKQFVELAGQPVICHSLRQFQEEKNVTSLIVVCYPEFCGKLEKIIKDHTFDKIKEIVPGGATRQRSSYNGLQECDPDTEIVLIHDAARPLVTSDIINNVITSTFEYGAACPVADMEDTVVATENGNISSFSDRSRLKRAQTPQGFKYKTILEAHEKAARAGKYDYTDDCGLIMDNGYKVRIVEGDNRNLKITESTDLEIAHVLFKKERIG